ncbi:MAG: PepSY domain-containing protein [Betaproteobacteria bacterium]|nr:PepSY domain-containing protein [Betaproteobacteria bacterium]
MQRKYYLAALAVLSATTLGGAYAAKPSENDALAIAGAKIDMTQAVTAAEQHVGGKASRAEYERYKGQWAFDVEVVKGKRVMDVKVDPASGKVIASAEDKTDHDDAHDRAD